MGVCPAATWRGGDETRRRLACGRHASVERDALFIMNHCLLTLTLGQRAARRHGHCTLAILDNSVHTRHRNTTVSDSRPLLLSSLTVGLDSARAEWETILKKNNTVGLKITTNVVPERTPYTSKIGRTDIKRWRINKIAEYNFKYNNFSSD